jgi:hypothetical protein
VLERGVEDRGARSVESRVGVLGQLQGDDLAGRVGPVALGVGPERHPRDHQLDDVLVLVGDVVQVLMDPAGTVVRPEYLEPLGRLPLGELGGGEALVVAPQGQVDALLLQGLPVE